MAAVHLVCTCGCAVKPRCANIPARKVNCAVAAMEDVLECSKLLEIDLKDMQLEAILSFVNGRDTFVSLPTGYGKSLVYAILPSVFDRIKG